MRLLLVEDKDSFRKLLERALQDTDWNVVAVADPESALRELQTDVFDAMVTDLRLPGISGLDLLKQAKRFQPMLRVILMSAYGEPRDIVDAIHAGADDFLPKPFDLDVFIQLLEGLRCKAAAPPPDPREPWITCSAAMRNISQMLLRTAESDVPALFTGEHGVGRSRAARRLHTLRHPDAPFLIFPAATPPQNDWSAALRLAQDGSVMIAELGELAATDVPRLLAAIDSPAGKAVRWMASASDVETLPDSLRLRFGAIVLTIPPLRDRKEDVLPLFRFHLERLAKEESRATPLMERVVEKELLARAWHGNAKELAWCAAQALRATTTGVLGPLPLSAHAQATLCLPWPEPGTLESMLHQVQKAAERQVLCAALKTRGMDAVSTAQDLGLTLRTFTQRLRDHHISLDDGDLPA